MPSPPIADTRLSGTRLIIARSVWIVLMLLSCGLYLASVLVYYVQLHGFQEGVYAHLISTPAVVNGYDAFEFSSALLTGPYATLNFTLVTLVLPPFWIAVSLVIFWRRSDDWMALIVALFLVMLVTIFSPALSALGNVFLSLLATGLGAVLFQPLRQQLQRAVNRLMFGERDEPYRVLFRLGNRLEATLATEALVPTIVQTVAQALRLPFVAITYKQQGEDILAASTGEAREREA